MAPFPSHRGIMFTREVWMPIFEFRCESCESKFAKLMFSQRTDVLCPHCSSPQVKRLPSTFGMSGVQKQTSSCGSCSKGTCSSCGH
jgi:putative FmdB family regulatory protein